MDIFTQISILLAISAGFAVMARTMKQPIIISYILTGIVIGPAVLGVVHESEIINIMSKFGIALLLFTVGLGLSPSVVKEVGKTATIVGAIQVTFSTLLATLLLSLVGVGTGEAILLAISLSFSSTIIILKLLSDNKEQNQLHGKLTIGILIFQDILATIALVFIAASSRGGFSPLNLIILLVKGIALIALIMAFSRFVLSKMTTMLSQSHELLFLFSLAWAFGIATLFNKIGFSLEVGALFSGVALADMIYSSEIASKMRPLRDFFLIVFFISLGAELELGSVGSILLPAVLVSVAVIIFKPLIVTTIVGLFGYTKKTSFKAGITHTQISEFSLIMMVLASESGLVHKDVLTLVTMVAVITITVSTYLISYDDFLYKLFESHLSLFERRKVKFEQAYQSEFDAVVIGYRKGGREFIKALKDIKLKALVIDYDPEVIDELDRKNIPYVYGDVTQVDLLDEIDISEAKLIVSTITEFEPVSNLIDLLEARTEKDTIIVANADTPQHAQELYDKGVNYVMMPHSIGGRKVAEFLQKNGLSKRSFEAHKKRHIKFIQDDIAEEIQIKRHHAIGVVALNHKLAEIAEEKITHHKPKEESTANASKGSIKDAKSKSKSK